MPYAIFRDARVVRVKHNDLDKSWWMRGDSFDERDMKRVERVMLEASGLQRLFRSHDLRHGYVDFRFSAERFPQVACALLMTYRADSFYETRLKEYPAPAVAGTRGKCLAGKAASQRR